MRPRHAGRVAAALAHRFAPGLRAAAFVFAAEDTLGTPVTALDPIEVTAERIGIAEILDRCIRREEESRGRIDSHDFTELVKTVISIGGSADRPKKEIVHEQVRRISTSRPDVRRVVLLSEAEYELVGRERRDRKEKIEAKGSDGSGISVRVEDFDDLPFYLEDRDDYDFRILGREIVGERVVYQVSLAPRSDFQIAPAGRVWVDTSNFQILREEFDFGDRVPMPIFVRSIGPVVREREPVGEVWVTSRFLVHVELRVGWMRFLDDEIPDRIDIVASYRDHRMEEAK